MKKIIIISGIIAAFLLTFLLTGAADKDDTVKQALRQGKRRYEAAEYNEALELYETGLASNPEHKALNFNAAQSAYLLGEYEKAAEYYEKSENCIEKFLNAGNIFFRAGEIIEDKSQKGQYYIQAVQIYQEGIIKFPQNVPLKYNYEIAKEKAEEFLEDTEQEQEQEQEQNEQGEQGEQGESEQGESQDSEESEESEENQAQESEENQSEGEEQEEQEENGESGELEENETDLDREAIERILQMLESQEEESLKNNQEMISGGDEKNGW